MNQDDVELAVLASVNSLDKLSFLRGQQISVESFINNAPIFSFIEEHVREYGGDVPTQQLLEAKFNKKLPETHEQDFEYLVHDLRKRELSVKVSRVLEKGVQLLVDEEDPDSAVAHIVSELAHLKNRRRITSNQTDGNALKRLEAYQQRKQAIEKGMSIGLQTGLDFFDEGQLGISPGNLLGIVGNTSIGKSWLLEYIAIAMYVKNDAKVLFISPEMTVEEVEGRWDTITGRFFGVELSNLNLAKGKNINIEAYKAFLERAAKRQDWVTYEASDQGGAFTLPVIEDLAAQMHPDVIAIDGLPLLGTGTGARSSAQWEKLSDIANGLKNLAKAYGYVILLTNQAVRGAEGKEELQLSDSGYSYAFVQSCDQVVMISAPKDGREDVKLVRLMKRRIGKQTARPAEIKWDVDRGIIG